MSNVIRVSKAAAVRLGWIALLLCCWCLTGIGADSSNATVTVMTRNVDAGTDLGYIFAATDEDSFVQGMAATLAELQASNFQQRAARLVAELGASMPDLIALQEVTLWRTGPIQQPPATNILYDQLDLILAELGKTNLHYGVIAVQSELDAEAPVPSAGIDLRITDRDVILARLDLPQSQFDLFNAQTHRYRSVFSFGNPILGQITVPSGWMAVDVMAGGSKFRFVNTHLQSTVPRQSALHQHTGGAGRRSQLQRGTRAGIHGHGAAHRERGLCRCLEIRPPCRSRLYLAVVRRGSKRRTRDPQ
jgi:hypothetical protein